MNKIGNFHFVYFAFYFVKNKLQNDLILLFIFEKIKYKIELYIKSKMKNEKQNEK